MGKYSSQLGREPGSADESNGLDSLFGGDEEDIEESGGILAVTENISKSVSATPSGDRREDGGGEEEYIPTWEATTTSKSAVTPMVPQINQEHNLRKAAQSQSSPASWSPFQTPSHPAGFFPFSNKSSTNNPNTSQSNLPELATGFPQRTESSNEGESAILPGQKKWNLSDEKLALIAERDEAFRQCELAKKNRDQALDDAEGMEKELAEATKAIKAAQMNRVEARELDGLKDQIRALEGGNQRLELKARMAESKLESEKEEVEWYKKRLISEAHAFQKEKQELVEQTKEVREAVDEIKEEKDSLQKVIDSLETELDTENESKFRLVRGMEKLKEQIANAPRASTLTELSSLHIDLASLTSTIDNLQTHITGLQSLVDSSAQTIRTQARTIEGLNDEIATGKLAAKNMIEDTAARLAEKDRALAEAIQKRFDEKGRAEGVMSVIERRRADSVGILVGQRDKFMRERDEALTRIKTLEEKKKEWRGDLGERINERQMLYMERDVAIKNLDNVLRRVRQLETLLPGAPPEIETSGGNRESFMDKLKRGLRVGGFEGEFDKGSGLLTMKEGEGEKLLFKEMETRLAVVEEELRAAKSELANTHPPSTLKSSPKAEPKKKSSLLSKILKRKPKASPKPCKIALPRPTKHYWDPNWSLRHPAEPKPTEQMIEEAKMYMDNPGTNAWPKWYLWRNYTTTHPDIQAAGSGNGKGQGKGADSNVEEESVQIFDVEKGWQKEKGQGLLGKRKREKEVTPRVAGSKISERNNKGVGPERLIEVEQDDVGGKRRRVE